jgi:hypothetical protein
MISRQLNYALFSTVLLISGIEQVRAENSKPVEFEFSKLKQQKVVLQDDASVVRLKISCATPKWAREEIAETINSAEAKFLAIRALSSYLQVPSDSRLVVDKLQIKSASLVNGVFVAYIDVDKRSIQSSKGASSNDVAKIESSTQASGQGIEHVQSPAPTTNTKNSNVTSEKRPRPVVISSELLSQSPKMPGSRGESMQEHLNWAAIAIGALVERWPTKVGNVEQYSSIIQLFGADLNELIKQLKVDASEDIRLTFLEKEKVFQNIDQESRAAFERLVKIEFR